MAKKLFHNLFNRTSKMSWRRLTMCGTLQVFAAYALMKGTLDATTWAYFAGSLAGMYVGGDTGEKIAKHFRKDGEPALEDIAESVVS